MPNMSYVIFENTYNDLYDTFQKMKDLGAEQYKLSESEQDYFIKLVKLCNEISAEYVDEINLTSKL